MTKGYFLKRCEKLYREYLDYKELSQYGEGHFPASQIDHYSVKSDKALWKLRVFENEHSEFNF
jgi:hypothetical protein